MFFSLLDNHFPSSLLPLVPIHFSLLWWFFFPHFVSFHRPPKFGTILHCVIQSTRFKSAEVGSRSLNQLGLISWNSFLFRFFFRIRLIFRFFRQDFFLEFLDVIIKGFNGIELRHRLILNLGRLYFISIGEVFLILNFSYWNISSPLLQVWLFPILPKLLGFFQVVNLSVSEFGLFEQSWMNLFSFFEFDFF